MSLGEAFIEVRADMRPFIRDLDRQVHAAVQRVQTATNQAFSHSLTTGASNAGGQAGQAAGTSFNRQFRNSITQNTESSNVFLGLAGALASALDDGISALPVEVKAAIVGGALLASPLIGAIIGAAITTGLGVAIVGIGVLLAAQFTDVQERATRFGSVVRGILAGSAEAFGPAVINALDLIQSRISALEPTLRRVFDSAAQFVEPLTVGLLNGISAFVNVLDQIAPKLQPFIETFALGLQGVLETISEGFKRLANTGEAGQQALRDLFFIVNALIGTFFGLIEALTYVNVIFHRVFDLVQDFNPVIGLLARLLGEEIPHAEGATIVSNFNTADSFSGLIAATNEEEQAAKDLIRALDGLVDATYNNIQVDIDFERSLDRISDSLKENGRDLDVHNEKGRQNLEAFMKGLKDAEARALQRLQVQGYTAEQAAALYNQEISQLRNVAAQAGITGTQFDALFGDIIAVSQLRLSSEEMGVDGLAAGLDEATANALALLHLINTLKRATISGGVGGARIGGFADGDIVNRPTLGVFGEAGPEVIIPLTKPARAAELAQKSGLTTMLGSNGTVVMVFIGEEQLESRMMKVVEGNNKNQSMALSQGTRRF